MVFRTLFTTGRAGAPVGCMAKVQALCTMGGFPFKFDYREAPII